MTRKTSVAIDEDLLREVQQILDTPTLRATIDQAFRQVIRSQARRDEVRALTTMEGLDLAEPDVMAGAWRS